MDDSGLANCVVFSCGNPPVDGGVYCAKHMSLVPAPSPPIVGLDEPDDPEPDAPDMAMMEPQWDGTQWVLKPRESRVNENQELRRKLDTVRGLVKELMAELDIEEAATHFDGTTDG